MNNKLFISFIFSICFVLLSCDGGPKINGQTATEIIVVSDNTIKNGQIYYETNCGGCHSAGLADVDFAFNATDLKLSQNIVSNMSAPGIYGGANNLMVRFSNIHPTRITQLKAYLDSIDAK